MDPEQQDRETENSQWNYLDGTPARLNEDVGRGGGLLEQTVADVVHMLNPFSWFRKKPSRIISHQSHHAAQQRRAINGDRTDGLQSRKPAVANNSFASRQQDERPAKRHRPEFSSGSGLENAGLPKNTQSHMDEEMPPNVEFMADERPAQPSSSKSYSDMMTDDEDETPPTRFSSGINRKSTVNSDDTRRQSNRIFFNAAAQKAESNSRRSMPVQSPEKKNTFLPLIETSNLNKSRLRNPLMDTTKTASPKMSPAPSRKRGFDAVDNDDGGDVPKLFSMFPKSSERSTGPVLSRFGSATKFGETSSNNNKTAPLYAMKRVETMRNADFSKDRLSLSPFKALPSLQIRQHADTSVVDSVNQPKLSTAFSSRKTAPVKLDYSYVIQSPFPSTLRGQYQFVSAVVVPNGELAKAIKVASSRDDRESSVASGSIELNTSLRLCNKCGISVKLDGGNKCEVCERLKIPGKTANKEDEPAAVTKPSTSGPKEHTAQKGVLYTAWSCDLCGEANREEEPCKSCGKSRKTTSPSNEHASQKRTRPSSPAPTEKAKDSKKSSTSFTKPKDSADAKQPSSTDKTPSSSATASSPPANDLWSKLSQIKNWTCSECMCSNGDQLTECPACGTAKPGTVSAKKADTSAATEPSFSFGGAQTALLNSTSTIRPTVGFSFGVPQAPPVSNSSKPAEASVTAATSGFSFGGLTAPKEGTASSTVVASTGGFSGFSFGNLAGPSSAPKAASITTSADTSVAAEKLGATFSFGGLPAVTTTTATPTPSTGFGIPSFSSAGSGGPSIFAGFASGSSATSTQPSEPSSGSGPQNKLFTGFGLPAASTATGTESVVKPTAASGINFQFGAAPASGTSAFAGFGAITPSGTASVFGQNGLAPQTNGLTQPNANAVPSFGFSSGAPLFGGATSGMQNGNALSQIPAPGFMSAVAGTAPNGTFGSTTPTIGGSAAPQRRVLVPKRRIQR